MPHEAAAEGGAYGEPSDPEDATAGLLGASGDALAPAVPASGRRGRVENLRAYAFKPGQSGNPTGGRKGPTLRGAIAELMARHEIAGKRIAGGKTVQQLLAEVIIRGSLKGKFPFVKEVFDRLEGRVAERLAGHDGGPLGPAAAVDLSRVSDDDLARLDAIFARLAPRPGEPDPIDDDDGPGDLALSPGRAG